MVLDNVAATPTDSFSESPPASDVDPYNTTNIDYHPTRSPTSLPVNQPGQPHLFVNLNSLQRRWSLLTQKSHPRALVERITESCKFATNALGRPLRQEEADALAWHLAHALRVASYGTPTGSVLGGMLAYRSRKTYRFPGWSPMKEGSKWTPDVFGPFTGQRARIMWQTARTSAYMTCGLIVGQVFFGTYGLSIGLAGRTMDPRLEDLDVAMKRRAQDGTLEAVVQGRVAPQRETSERPVNQTEQRVQEGWNRQRQRQAQVRDTKRQIPAADNASPTGGAYNAEFGDSSTNTGLLSDSQLKEQEVRQHADSRTSEGENTATNFDMDEITNRPRNLDPDNTSRPPRELESAPGRQGGSTWERLRQEAAAGRSRSKNSMPSGRRPDTKREQQDSSTVGDSFSFSNSDEEKQLAKSEAQKDFDARVEREREGKDFSEEGRSGRRW